MIDKSKTYKTRDGREVRIYATDGEGPFPVHGAIRLPTFWCPASWNENGLYKTGGIELHDYDLIEVKPRHKRTVWLNVYDNEVIHGGWKTKDDAEQYRHNIHCIACIKVDLDFEEGEGL